MGITFYEVIVELGRKGRSSVTIQDRFEDLITFCNFLQELKTYIRFPDEIDSKPLIADELIDTIAHHICYVRYQDKEARCIHPRKIRLVIGETKGTDGECYRQLVWFSRFTGDEKTFIEECDVPGSLMFETERLSVKDYMSLVLNNYSEPKQLQNTLSTENKGVTH